MSNPNDIYLESQILTAPPQRLRLMLIDGALLFGRQASQLWNEGRWDDATEAFARCRDIVEELLQSIDAQASPLAQQVADLYTYLFQTLAEAQVRRDQTRLDEFLSLLETERETWHLLCENPSGDTTESAPLEGIPTMSHELTESGGFSLDA